MSTKLNNVIYYSNNDDNLIRVTHVELKKMNESNKLQIKNVVIDSCTFSIGENFFSTFMPNVEKIIFCDNTNGKIIIDNFVFSNLKNLKYIFINDINNFTFSEKSFDEKYDNLKIVIDGITESKKIKPIILDYCCFKDKFISQNSSSFMNFKSKKSREKVFDSAENLLFSAKNKLKKIKKSNNINQKIGWDFTDKRGERVLNLFKNEYSISIIFSILFIIILFLTDFNFSENFIFMIMGVLGVFVLIFSIKYLFLRVFKKDKFILKTNKIKRKYKNFLSDD